MFQLRSTTKQSCIFSVLRYPLSNHTFSLKVQPLFKEQLYVCNPLQLCVLHACTVACLFPSCHSPPYHESSLWPCKLCLSPLCTRLKCLLRTPFPPSSPQSPGCLCRTFQLFPPNHPFLPLFLLSSARTPHQSPNLPCQGAPRSRAAAPAEELSSWLHTALLLYQLAREQEETP